MPLNINHETPIKIHSNSRFDLFSKNLIIGNQWYVILDDEKSSELDSSFILLKFVGTKRWVIFQGSYEKIYVFIFIFRNKTILGTILELLLSLATSF